jgi:hypothetical protein
MILTKYTTTTKVEDVILSIITIYKISYIQGVIQ